MTRVLVGMIEATPREVHGVSSHNQVICMCNPVLRDVCCCALKARQTKLCLQKTAISKC